MKELYEEIKSAFDFNPKVSKKKDASLVYEANRQGFKQLIAIMTINGLVLDDCRMTICDHTNKYLVEGKAEVLSILESNFMTNKAIMYGRIKAHKEQYDVDIVYCCGTVETSVVHMSINNGSLEVHYNGVNTVIEKFSKPGSLDNYIDRSFKPMPSKRYSNASPIEVSIDIHINSSIIDFDDFDYSRYDDEMDREREKWLY